MQKLLGLLLVFGVSVAKGQNQDVKYDSPEVQGALEELRKVDPSHRDQLAAETRTLRVLLTKQVRTLTDEIMIARSLQIVGSIGDENTATLLAQHLDYRPKLYVPEVGNAPPTELDSYECALALVELGSRGMAALAETLAGSDDDKIVRLARVTMVRIGCKTVPIGWVSLNDPIGYRISREIVQRMLELEKYPKRMERLKRSIEFFAKGSGHEVVSWRESAR